MTHNLKEGGKAESLEAASESQITSCFSEKASISLRGVSLILPTTTRTGSRHGILNAGCASSPAWPHAAAGHGTTQDFQFSWPTHWGGCSQVRGTLRPQCPSASHTQDRATRLPVQVRAVLPPQDWGLWWEGGGHCPESKGTPAATSSRACFPAREWSVGQKSPPPPWEYFSSPHLLHSLGTCSGSPPQGPLLCATAGLGPSGLSIRH